MTKKEIELLTLEIKRLNLKVKSLENKCKKENKKLKPKDVVKILNPVSIYIGNQVYTKTGVIATVARSTKCFVVVEFERKLIFPSAKGLSEVKRKQKNLERITK